MALRLFRVARAHLDRAGHHAGWGLDATNCHPPRQIGYLSGLIHGRVDRRLYVGHFAGLLAGMPQVPHGDTLTDAGLQLAQQGDQLAVAGAGRDQRIDLR